MRLTAAQRAVILQTVAAVVGAQGRVLLYGSRLDDSARGGDVDLLIETATPMDLMQRAQIALELETRLELPVDILCHVRGAPASPFAAIAYRHAAPL